ncbi:hypothetical protein Tco_0439931 [Tanacetum coccineum]
MGDANPIRTLGDYSKPSYESYRNTIELPEGNNVVPLRSDTIRLVQNGCSFHGLRSEGPNQHLKDFLKLVDSLNLDSGVAKAISLPQDVPSTFDRRLIELEHQVQRLMEAYIALMQPTQVNKITSSCEICSGPHDTQYCMESLKQAFVEYASSRTDEAGVQIFYDHVDYTTQMAIDYAAGSPDYINATLEQELESMECKVESLMRNEVLLEYEVGLTIPKRPYQEELEARLLNLIDHQEDQIRQLEEDMRKTKDTFMCLADSLIETLKVKIEAQRVHSTKIEKITEFPTYTPTVTPETLKPIKVIFDEKKLGRSGTRIQSSRKHFKTLSLDESRSPDFDLFSDQEEYSEEEVAKTMAETMEQYMSKTRADYGSGIARPKIEDKDSFELKGQFLKELLDNTFSGSDHEDANEHIKKVS